MCGIAGLITFKSQDLERSKLEKMADAIAHRGPDDSGVWLDQDTGIGMVHRRLSVLDLSSAGHQPMISNSGRFVIAFNGEIYNHLNLRKELNQNCWRGHSDTETLISGFEQWGIKDTLRRATGMFAFALWDREEEKLILGRDRLGEKPLYYGWQGNTFYFASELNALKAHNSFNSEVNRDALALLMRHSVIPAPYCIYEGISKLMPGAFLSVSLRNKNICLKKYWSHEEIINKGYNHPFDGTQEDSVIKLEQLLSQSISQQLISDVPVGAFLSGGIDSSTVVALMQAQISRKVKTFTIGFNEEEYNEAAIAGQIASHLGTDHTDLYVTPDKLLDVIPILPRIYDEPFADASQIPTFLLSQLARQHVTVSLSGDGGDELFGGYNRYIFAQKFWNKISYLPLNIRKLVKKAVFSLPPDKVKSIVHSLSWLIPGMTNQPNLLEKINKGCRVLSAKNETELYMMLVSQWLDECNPVLLHDERPIPGVNNEVEGKNLDFISQMMANDLIGYLPDDLLVKTDRAAMSVSLETRMPLLDHQIVEFAWSLPLDYKLNQGVGKLPLRKILSAYIPQNLLDMPKRGFNVPIAYWLRSSLKEWAEELLSESRLKQEGYLKSSQIRKKWSEHLSGKHNWDQDLWNVLMFQAWLESESKH